MAGGRRPVALANTRALRPANARKATAVVHIYRWRGGHSQSVTNL
jgi:hypothetical protein